MSEVCLGPQLGSCPSVFRDGALLGPREYPKNWSEIEETPMEEGSLRPGCMCDCLPRGGTVALP